MNLTEEQAAVRIANARAALGTGPSNDLTREREERLEERAEKLEYHVAQLLDVIEDRDEARPRTTRDDLTAGQGPVSSGTSGLTPTQARRVESARSLVATSAQTLAAEDEHINKNDAGQVYGYALGAARTTITELLLVLEELRAARIDAELDEAERRQARRDSAAAAAAARELLGPRLCPNCGWPEHSGPCR